MHLETIQHLRALAATHDDTVPIAKALLLDLLDSYEKGIAPVPSVNPVNTVPQAPQQPDTPIRYESLMGAIYDNFERHHIPVTEVAQRLNASEGTAEQLVKARSHIERLSKFLFECSPKPEGIGPRGHPLWSELVTDSYPFYLPPEHIPPASPVSLAPQTSSSGALEAALMWADAGVTDPENCFPATATEKYQAAYAAIQPHLKRGENALAGAARILGDAVRNLPVPAVNPVIDVNPALLALKRAYDAFKACENRAIWGGVCEVEMAAQQDMRAHGQAMYASLEAFMTEYKAISPPAQNTAPVPAVNDVNPVRYLIISEERRTHGMVWFYAPNSKGYTACTARAGRYTEAEAATILSGTSGELSALRETDLPKLQILHHIDRGYGDNGAILKTLITHELPTRQSGPSGQ